MVAFYVADSVHYAIRSAEGTWGADTVLDRGVAPKSAGLKAVLSLDDIVHVFYYGVDGTIWYRRLMRAPAKQVTDRAVIQDAVDSQEPAADVVVDGETVRVLFVEESSRSIFSTQDDGGWQPPTLRVDKIRGSWIRGNVCTRRDGKKVYGYIYDAGSEGGAGMNRFVEIVLNAR